jgi:hypothetical protein
MMIPIAAPAINTAHGLEAPISFATSEGNPKMPLPIMELITSAARLHRPMARIKRGCEGEEMEQYGNIRHPQSILLSVPYSQS